MEFRQTEEGQYDYSYENSELVSKEEKKQNFFKEVKGLFNHIINKSAEAGMTMGAQTEVPEFNSTLSVKDPLTNSVNPLSNSHLSNPQMGSPNTSVSPDTWGRTLSRRSAL